MMRLFLPMKCKMLRRYALLIVPISLILAFSPKNEITVFLIGDSTMADKPYSDGNPEKGWGQVFPLYFSDGIKIENHAVNGRSSKSFRDEGRWDIIMKRIKPGDYVIIQFGHNDEKINDSTRYAAADTDYRRNLIKYVEETRKKGANPILATPIVRRRFDERDLFFDTHERYPDVVREIAVNMHVPILDLHQRTMELVKNYGNERSKVLYLHIQPGEYFSLPEGREDDTHLSAIGAFRVCDLAIEELSSQIPQLTGFLRK